MTHPSESMLALFAGGELGIVERWRVGRHVKNCASCGAVLQGFTSVKQDLAALADRLPAGVNWDKLSAEMAANIHLGIEAGECIAPVVTASKPYALGWRAATVMASATAMLMAAWWLNIPKPIAPVETTVVVLGSNSAGIEMKQNGSALMLLHTRARSGTKPLYVSAPGSLRARYVDAETGQVTINNVYTD